MTTLPEEAVKAAKDVLYYANPNDIERALTAAAPHLAAVRVKKLEWGNARITEDGREAEDAQSPVGRYIATDTGWFLLGQTGYEVERGLYQAKAAAQADYEARILSALEPSALDMGNPITLTYTNYRGETSERAITPIRPWFGSTEWHPEPQWLLRAYDHDKGAERDFALKDFGRQEPSAARDLALEEAARWHESEAEGYEAEIGGTDVTGLLLAKEHRISAIAIRSLSSPDHADAGKVEGDGWMPIESAPKDGGFLAANSTEVWAAWHYDSPNWHARYGSRGATHWRPLPSAPSQEVAGS